MQVSIPVTRSTNSYVIHSFIAYPTNFFFRIFYIDYDFFKKTCQCEVLYSIYRKSIFVDTHHYEQMLKC